MMSDIYSYLMSIAGVVIFGSVIDLILPEGNIRKHIQGVYSLVVMLVILMPLPSLLNKSFDIESYLFKTQIDDTYIENIYRQRIILLEQSIKNELALEDITDLKITIITDEYSESMKILQVIVDKSLSLDAPNDIIIKVIKKQTGIDSERIVFI